MANLARAIAASSGWSARGEAVLVVREAPEPLIAAIGRFDEAGEAWLSVATQQLATTLPHTVVLDDAAVRTACALLADALLARFGREALSRMRFAAVPRGGLFVLGALAYQLDLAHHQFWATDDAPARAQEPPDHAGEAPATVVVDDIAISGLRLSRTLEQRPEARLIVATLHAHPGLRSAFVARHPRVEAFVSAHDLQDRAPTIHGDGYRAWRERWRRRAAAGTVWIGDPDHVVYPWNEPDTGVWNAVTGREEPGWLVVPPERSLKRRVDRSIAVQSMPSALASLALSADAITGEVGDRVVVGLLGSGTAFELEGVAADMWRALADTGDVATAAVRLGEVYDVAVEALERDVAAFTRELIAAGVLQEAAS